MSQSLVMTAFPVTMAAIKKDPGPIPELKPPRGEIASPTPDRAILIGGLLVAFAVLFLGRAFRTREVVPPAPPELPPVIANRELDAIEGHEVTPLVAERCAQIVRQYVTTAFQLGPEALTNTEVSERFAAHCSSDEDTRARLFVFFRDCDVARFGPGGVEEGFEPVKAAREVVGLLEWKRSGQMNVLPEVAVS